MAEWTDRAVTSLAAAFVQEWRADLSALAREKYAAHGRGLIAVSVRGPRPVAPDLRSIQYGFRPLAEYRRRTAPLLSGPSRDRVEDTIRQIATYNPETHVPVTVVAGPQCLTVSLLMRLDGPIVLDEADGIH